MRLKLAFTVPALLLPVALLTATGATPVAAPAPVTAVVSYVGALPALDGVRVQQSLPAVHAAVVSARPAELARLAAAPGVRSVVPDRSMTLTGTTSGTETGIYANARVGGGAGRPYAGRGARVAVVDTGVSDSAALNRASGRLVDAYDSRRADVPADAPLDDGYGHGTFMASIVAGGPVPGSDGRAVGVAPGATVLVVRVAEADGSTSLSQVLGGLNWIAAHPHQVDVVSLSLGADVPGDRYGRDPLVDAVQSVQDAGVTVVVAAGNEYGTLTDPGFLPTTITVGASSGFTGAIAQNSGSDVVAGFQKPDLVASGVSVLGVLPEDSIAAQENPQARVGQSLFRGSGTSQATAVTSGVAALLLARFPGATPADVKASLTSAAVPVDNKRAGAGLLRTPPELVHAPDPAPGTGGSDDGGSSDDPAWSYNSWSFNSWSYNSWSYNSWSYGTWSSSEWGGR